MPMFYRVFDLQDNGPTGKCDISLENNAVSNLYTSDFVEEQLANQGIDAIVSDIQLSDYENKKGTVFKTEYTADYTAGSKQGSMKQCLYDLFLDNYFVEVAVTENGEDVSPALFLPFITRKMKLSEITFLSCYIGTN